MIKAIIAIGKNGEIGQGNDLPWGRDLPKDLQHFKEETLGKIVVLGRKTQNTLPFKNKFFPARCNMVITSDESLWMLDHYDIDEMLFNQIEDFETTLHHTKTFSAEEDVYIVGGASIYKQLEPFVDEWIITRVDQDFPEADTLFEPNLTNFEDQLKYKDVSGEKYEATVSYWSRKVSNS